MIRYDDNDSELFNNLTQALDEYGWEAANAYKNKLLSDGKVSSGNLVKSVSPKVAYKAQGGEFTVFLELADYWKYVEKGLKGDRNATSPFPVPSDAGGKPAWKRIYPFILDWVRQKPVSPRAMSDGKLPTEKQLSAMISKGIIKNGIVAGNQLEDTLRSINAYALPRLQEALDADWEEYSVRIYDDINRMLKI